MPAFHRGEALPSASGYLGFAHLKQAGFSQSPRFDLMSLLAWADKCVFFDDFWGDTENLDMYLETAAGTSAAAGNVSTQLANGAYRLDPGTVDDDFAALVGALIWAGNRNIVFQAAVKSEDVTGFKVELGFGNLAGRNTQIVNAYDTPSYQSNQTNVMVAVVDTDGTNGDRWKLCTDGTTTNMNATGTQSGHAFGAAASALTTAVADVYDTITLTSRGGNTARARLYRNGTSLAHHGGALASQINGEVLMAPYFVAQARAGSDSPLVDLDYWFICQDRNVGN